MQKTEFHKDALQTPICPKGGCRVSTNLAKNATYLARCASRGPVLQSQEDFAAMEETGEPEEEEDPDQGNDQFAAAGGNAGVEELFDRAAGQPHGELVVAKAAEKIACQVQGDGIHANPDERLAPLAPSSHVNHPIERAQQQGAVAAGHGDAGGSPDFLDDRKFDAPEKSQRDRRRARAQKPGDLFLSSTDWFWRNRPAKMPSRPVAKAGRVLSNPSGS